MSIELSHITIPARSKWASATFLAGILDVPTGPPRNLSVPVTLSNGVTLDYVDADGFTPQHHAFLASEAEFDAAFARLRSTGITYYAGPRHQRPGEISHGRDGRRVYFDDPNGHTIELATRLLGLPVHQGNLNTTERVAKSPPSAGCAPRPRRAHRSGWPARVRASPVTAFHSAHYPQSRDRARGTGQGGRPVKSRVPMRQVSAD